RMLPGAVNMRVEPGGLRTEQPIFLCRRPLSDASSELLSSCVPRPVPPSTAASASYLVFCGTGFGKTAATDIRWFLNGYGPLAIEASGPSGTPGVDQITVRLPDAGLDYWEGAMTVGASVVLSVNGTMANTSWILFSQ